MHLIVPVELIVKSWTHVDPGFKILINPTGKSHLKFVPTVTEVFSELWVAEHWMAVTERVPCESNWDTLATVGVELCTKSFNVWILGIPEEYNELNRAPSLDAAVTLTCTNPIRPKSINPKINASNKGRIRTNSTAVAPLCSRKNTLLRLWSWRRSVFECLVFKHTRLWLSSKFHP